MAVEYLGRLKEKYGIKKLFLFLNNTVNLTNKILNELCDE